MYWNSAGGAWVEGHSSTAAPEPASTWYFAEGATHLFDHYLLIANPSSAQTARLLLTFRDESGPFLSRDFTLGPRRRLTVKVNDLVGSRGQVSTEVRSLNNVGVVAERTMLWEAGGIPWEGGRNSLGASQAAERWFLPEGATHIFDQYVLIYNPSSSEEARVTCRFQNQAGPIASHELTVEPGARATVNARAVAGRQDQLSTLVESTNAVGVVVERAMYWNPGEIHWGGGHAALGIAVER